MATTAALQTPAPPRIGHNSATLPPDERDAVRIVVTRVSKLMSDRAMVNDKIRETTAAAKNDGFDREVIRSALRFGRMSPEERTNRAKSISEALSLYGFGPIDAADEDASGPRAAALREVVRKVRGYETDRTHIAEDIREVYAEARDCGLDVKGIKSVVRFARMEADDREEWFARVDRFGTFLGYW